MTTMRLIRLIAFSGVALAGAMTTAPAQAPQPNGPVAKPLLNLDLAPEIDTVRGRVLRTQLGPVRLEARKTFAPAG